MLHGLVYIIFILNWSFTIAVRKNTKIELIAACLLLLIFNIIILLTSLKFKEEVFTLLFIPYICSLIAVFIEEFKAIVAFRAEQEIIRAICNWGICDTQARRIGTLYLFF